MAAECATGPNLAQSNRWFRLTPVNGSYANGTWTPSDNASLTGSWAPWLVPPVMATARALNRRVLPGPPFLLFLTAWQI